MPERLESICAELAAQGLGVQGVADGAPYQHLLEGCTSVLVFASGGTGLWEGFLADIRANPPAFSAAVHPLDEFVARLIRAADPDPPPGRRWIRCAAEPEAFIDFRALGLAAGLGWRSHMGLLVHPRYGLWISLRAALLLREELPSAGPLQGEGPCPGCSKPCMDACPGGAVGAEGWKAGACADFHLRSSLCSDRCHSRLSCPEGAGHAYGSLQNHYHSAQDTGRIMLARELGVPPGLRVDPPPWKHWSPSDAD